MTPSASLSSWVKMSFISVSERANLAFLAFFLFEPLLDDDDDDVADDDEEEEEEEDALCLESCLSCLECFLFLFFYTCSIHN